MFYSQIRVPSWVDHSPEYLNKSRKYFPAVGWLIGGIAVLTIFLLQLFLPLTVAILLSIAATVYATGAFHEDGFADSCDAFGGGWTVEQILTIMKDSRIGAFGTIGIILLLGLKWIALVEIGNFNLSLLLVTYLNAHVSSRFIASTFIQSHEYVQDIDKSKSKPITSQRLSLKEMVYSAFFMLTALLLFQPLFWYVLAFPIAYFAKLYLGYYFNKRIGGYTGDCLGATQQLSEVVFYLAVLALTKLVG